MNRLTIEYGGGYVPRALCSIKELGEASDCDLCHEACKVLETGHSGCEGCAIDACFNMLGEYENTGITPEQIKEIDSLYKAKCKELAEHKARQQDNALNLPCRIGQEVYIVSLNRAGYTAGEVASIKIGAHGASLRIYIPSDKQHINRAFEQIGKSVFFDQAAANEALEARNKKRGQWTGEKFI